MSRPDYPPRLEKKLARYPVKHCQNEKCGKQLFPKIRKAKSRGREYQKLESLKAFMKRDACNLSCSMQVRYQRKINTELTKPKPSKPVDHGAMPRHLVDSKMPEYLRAATTEFCARWGVRIPIEATATNTEALHDWTDTVQKHKHEYQRRQAA